MKYDESYSTIRDRGDEENTHTDDDLLDKADKVITRGLGWVVVGLTLAVVAVQLAVRGCGS